MGKIVLFLRQFGWLSLVAVVGSGLLIYGVWGIVGAEAATVEIVKEQVKGDKSEIVIDIVVDIAGAVEKPGVYKLASGSRIGDVLVMAGGLAEQADREWVAKTINLAEPLKDGGKIYIPEKLQSSNLAQHQTSSQNSNLININSASESELDSLIGIGEVRARAIIASRPYGSTEELVSKAKIPQSVYEKIKDSISIY